MNKTALILGGTGLVGSHLVAQLIENEAYSKIIVLARRAIPNDSEKVDVIVTDFKDLTFISSLPKIDSVFSCLGTTKQQTPDKNDYLFIELGIPTSILQALKTADIYPAKIHVVSAIGANSKAANFYMKMKGDLEMLIRESEVKQKYIYQPAVILGKRERMYKTWENVVFALSKFFDKMLSGKSMKYHTIEAKQIASAMIHYDLQANQETISYLTYNQMTAL